MISDLDLIIEEYKINYNGKDNKEKIKYLISLLKNNVSYDYQKIIDEILIIYPQYINIFKFKYGINGSINILLEAIYYIESENNLIIKKLIHNLNNTINLENTDIHIKIKTVNEYLNLIKIYMSKLELKQKGLVK